MAINSSHQRKSVNSSRSKSRNDISKNVNHEYSAQEILDQYSRNNPNYNSSKSRKKKRTAVVLYIIAALCLIIATMAGIAQMYLNSLDNTIQGGKTSQQIMDITDELAPVRSYREPFYVMLLGSDARPGQSFTGTRSDTNILVRIDPVKCIVTMISIPRDTEINLDGYGLQKFNAAYAYEGIPGVIRETKDLANVDINHYVEISFENLVNLVDAIGGVEVDVPEIISDPDAGDIVIQAGLQTLDGQSALVFARSRAYADGDFTRTSNQRLLVEAVIKKTLALPLLEIPGAVQALAECVSTDMSIATIVELALQFKDIGELQIYSAMVPSSFGTLGVVTDHILLQQMIDLMEQGKDPNLALDPNAIIDPDA